MIFKNFVNFLIVVTLSGIMSTTVVFAGEVQKIPLTKNEIFVLQQLGGEEIQNLVKGKSSNESAYKAIASNLTEDESQELLSVTPEQLDQIIAGEIDGSDILVTTLAVFGLILVIALLAG